MAPMWPARSGVTPTPRLTGSTGPRTQLGQFGTGSATRARSASRGPNGGYLRGRTKGEATFVTNGLYDPPLSVGAVRGC